MDRLIPSVFKVILELHEVHKFSTSVIMLLVTDKRTRACRLYRLIKKGSMSHTNLLTEFDIIALFNENLRFRTAGIFCCDIEEFRYWQFDCRDRAKQFQRILNVCCFLDHMKYLPLKIV